jgi:hypothetical protein
VKLIFANFMKNLFCLGFLVISFTNREWNSAFAFICGWDCLLEIVILNQAPLWLNVNWSDIRQSLAEKADWGGITVTTHGRDQYPSSPATMKTQHKVEILIVTFKYIFIGPHFYILEVYFCLSSQYGDQFINVSVFFCVMVWFFFAILQSMSTAIIAKL